MGRRSGAQRSMGTCRDCGKQRYGSRSDAKRAVRLMGSSQHFSVYRCGDFFHFGELPSVVVRGYATREGSRQYPPSVTREVDYLEAMRSMRRANGEG